MNSLLKFNPAAISVNIATKKGVLISTHVHMRHDAALNTVNISMKTQGLICIMENVKWDAKSYVIKVMRNEVHKCSILLQN